MKIAMQALRDVTAPATFPHSNLMLGVVIGLFYRFDRSNWASPCFVGKQTRGHLLVRTELGFTNEKASCT